MIFAFPYLFREPLGKVLFLHGWMSDGSRKSSYIKCLGYDVEKPQLSNWWFSTAVSTAQEAYDEFKPDVIVGSSRGGAVAMSIDSGDAPLILLAPAWRRFGDTKLLKKPNVIVIHSQYDDTVSFDDSVGLVKNSKNGRLIEAGEGHRLNCEMGSLALKEALSEFIPQKV